MKVSISQIETFYWVARLRSFRAASRQQHLTQPTISARIQELEAALGYRLFERHAHGADLTPKGRAFLGKAETLLHHADSITDCEETPMRGLLRVGSNESAALTGLDAFLSGLQQSWPGMKIELSVDVGSLLRSRLEAGGLDFALLTDPSSHPHIRNVLLGQSELCWVAATGLVKSKKPLSPRDLAQLPLVTVPAPSSLHTAITTWFAGARFSPPHLNTCNSLAIMLRLVAAGVAIAILPPSIFRRELAEGVVERLNVTRPVVPLPVYASYPLIGGAGAFDDITEMAREALLRGGMIA